MVWQKLALDTRSCFYGLFSYFPFFTSSRSRSHVLDTKITVLTTTTINSLMNGSPCVQGK
jgi:hypothetical protein